MHIIQYTSMYIIHFTLYNVQCTCACICRYVAIYSQSDQTSTIRASIIRGTRLSAFFEVKI